MFSLIIRAELFPGLLVLGSVFRPIFQRLGVGGQGLANCLLKGAVSGGEQNVFLL
jgi:hypothetical protein